MIVVEDRGVEIIYQKGEKDWKSEPPRNLNLKKNSGRKTTITKERRQENIEKYLKRNKVESEKMKESWGIRK